MSEDPRQILDEAARRRLGCQVMPRGGAWSAARLVRVDKAGVILDAPEAGLRGGEDLTVWFSLDEQPYRFDASVLRAAVPVPDRSPHAALLGFIDHFQRVEAAAQGPGAAAVTVLPPHGRGLELLGADARLIELAPRALSFAVPASQPLKFVSGGGLRVRLAAPGKAPQVVAGRVTAVRPEEGHYLYAVELTEIHDEAAHLALVAALRDLA